MKNLYDKMLYLKDFASRVKIGSVLKSDLPLFGAKENEALIDGIQEEEIKGIPILCTTKSNEKLVVKIIPIDRDTTYDNSHIEIDMLQFFTNNLLMTNVTPCFPWFLDAWIKIKTNKPCMKKIPFKKLEKLLNVQKKCNVLICEYIKSEDTTNWILKERMKRRYLSDDIFRSLIFQVVYTLSILQEKYNFVHNDFHPGNVLIDNELTKEEGYLSFSFKGKTFYIKNFGFVAKLWDFEYAQFHEPNTVSIKNALTSHAKEDFDPYVDIHFFLKCLLQSGMPEETHNFIMSLYSSDLLDDDIGSSRPQTSSDDSMYASTEYLTRGQLRYGVGEKLKLTTPRDLLDNDYFKCLTKVVPENILMPLYLYE